MKTKLCRSGTNHFTGTTTILGPIRNYRSRHQSVRHLGAMAQDFHEALGLGTEEWHIATEDADGVALAAIQGLNQKVESRGQRTEDRVQKLEAENTELKQTQSTCRKHERETEGRCEMKKPNGEGRNRKEVRSPKLESRKWGHRRTGRVCVSHAALALLISVFSFQFSAFAQSYAIDWHTIDGGGGTSTGGVYSISGTIGQPDAGAVMMGGSFSLQGGFWAMPTAVQETNAPSLTIAPATPGNASISWTSNTPGWVLQERTSLSAGSWTNSPSGTTNNIVVPAMLPAKFYRLYKP